MNEIYLFEKNDDDVEIFQLHPRIKQLKEFRATILEHKKLFYRFDGNANYSRDVGEILKDGVYRFSRRRLSDMDSSASINTYNSIFGYTPADLKSHQRVRLDLYINGYYNDLKYEYLPKRYNYYDDKKDNERQFYFLFFGDKRIYARPGHNSYDRSAEIENILSLPKEHFQLHMLLNSYFDELRDEKMKIDPTMFDITFYKKIKISQLELLCKTGILNDSMQDISTRIDTTSKILKQLRK